MAKPRKELSKILHDICDNVYFQPPESVRLVYPCIIYSLSSENIKHASDSNYIFYNQYSIQLISKTSEPIQMEKLRSLSLCSMNRVFIADNLYHYNYTIYF